MGSTGAAMLEKDVLVTISGLPGADTADGIELVVPGEYHFRNNTHFISYEETSDADGKETDTHCLMKITPEKVEVVKRGNITTKLIFEPDVLNIGMYNTPVGAITLGTRVTSLKINSEPHCLRTEMVYDLEMNYEFLQTCHLTVTVTD